MNLNIKFIIFILLIIIMGSSMVSATDFENINITSYEFKEVGMSNQENSFNEISYVEDYNYHDISSDDYSEDILEHDDSNYIVVNNWDELQYYCSLNDKDYTLKLKENTNYYPTDPDNSNYQIKIHNNVKIIGSNGSYFGDVSSNATRIRYIAIVVPDDMFCSISLENVTFKWIYSGFRPDGIFLQMGGKYESTIKNCLFEDIQMILGHSTIVYLKKGNAVLDNCIFINCTTGYGCISIYDPNSVKSVKMIVRNSYFENNYATTEPGCINNCGKLTVYNTTFIKNRSFWWAGAIHTHNYGNTTIYDSKFIDNVAGWNGGALYTYSYLQIYNTIFVGNNCTTNNGGGAIGACQYQSNPHIYIEKCLFENNANNCWTLDELSTSGTGRGGAISLMDEGSIEVRDTTFIANAASIGTAICAIDAPGYSSPDIIIVNNTFINHTRMGDVLNVRVDGTILNLSDNYFYGNSIVFSDLTLTKLNEGKEQAILQVNVSLTNPTYYDDDILNKTLYDVYINNKHVKTVNSSTFTVDFGDLDICDVYVIPTISNRKSNEVTITSTREYIFVSKSNGSDSNNGLSRDSPVNTISKALELARNYQNIILLDGTYDENISIDYDVTVKGECNATLSNSTKFTINSNNFTLKNLNIKNLNSDVFINQNNGDLSIEKCIIINNPNLLIDNNGKTIIMDSILLNNSKILKTNVNYNLDCNWWGNTLPTDLIINNYLVLNLTADKLNLEDKETSNVKVDFYLNNQVYNNIPVIDFNVTAFNGTVNMDKVNAGQSVIYTITDLENGRISVSYNDFVKNLDFIFIKSNPKVQAQIEDIMVGDDLTVKLTTPIDSTGNITVSINNMAQTKEVTQALTTFTFENLKADTYTITLTYSGDKKYISQNLSSSVKVSKYNSNTKLELGNIEVGENLIITVSLNGDATGIVTLHINGQITELTLCDAKSNYTILSIQRGDYIVSAVYGGDDKYLGSESSTFIEVDNLNATMTIKADDITYGDTAVFEITLNSNATGIVSVTVDGVSNTSQVINGIAEVYLNNLDAGIDKIIQVFYSGDYNYFNLTKNSTFSINKADLVFDISSSDVMAGDNVIITIHVPSRTKGTFIVDDKVSTIPLSGDVEFIISDLEIGEYDFSAIYNGNNYNTVNKSVTVFVRGYPDPQWPNTETNGKSEYATECNGEILFGIPITEVINGITIDSEGNIYVTTNAGIYSYTYNGTFRWNFTSSDTIGNFSSSVIGWDVIITSKSGDTLYLLNQSSGERYGSSNFYQASSLFAPIIDDEANIYVVSEFQYDSGNYNLVKIPSKLWSKGGDPIIVNLGKNTPVSCVSLNKDYIVVLTEARIRLIDYNTLKSVFTKSSANYKHVRPLISESNIVYCVLGDSIVAYMSSGSQLWKTDVSGGVGDKLYINEDFALYATDIKGNLYSFDLLDGKKRLISSLNITSGLLIDVNNNLYFGCDNLFYAIDSEGNVLWKTDLSSKVTGTPVMNRDGVIYVTTSDNKLFALGKGTSNLVNDSSDDNPSPTNSSDTTNVVSGNNNSPVNSNSNQQKSTAGKVTKKVSKITASKKTFKKSVKVKKYTITLKSGKTPIKNVKVTIKIGKKTYSAKTNAKGKAIFKIKKLTKKGKYTAIIKFAGNKNYKATSKKVKIVIK